MKRLFKDLWHRVYPYSYKEMFSGMLDAVLVFDTSDRLIHLNPAAESTLGIRKQDSLKRDLITVLAGQNDLLDLCRQQEALSEITLNTSQGLAQYEAHVTNWPGTNQKRGGRMVILHDVTRRAQAQAASVKNQQLLKQSEEKYRYLVDNIDEIIMTLDLEGLITYISPAVEHSTGFLVEEMIGKPLRSFIHPDDLPLIETNLPRALYGKADVLEMRILNSLGQVRYFRGYIRSIAQDGAPQGLLVLALDITERRQVEEALERRASQLALLKTIGEQIAANIELASVLDSAAHLIRKNFGYYHVAIFTPDREEGELVMRSSSGAFTELFPEYHHLDYGQGMVGWTAKNKSVLLSNDVRQEPRYTNLYPERILTRSELAVPILIGDDLAGVLDVQSPQVNAFDDNDVRVMKTIADQIAIAMENARLYEQLRRQLKDRERKENLLRIQRDLLIRLNAAKNLQEISSTTVEILANVLHASQVTLWWVDEVGQTIHVLGSLRPLPLMEEAHAPLSHGITGWAIQHGQPALIGDLRREARQPGVFKDSLSMMCVPLMSYSRAIGAISLESARPNTFTREDLRLMTSLASSLVVLIERARLFEEVERARSELEHRAEQLEIANARLLELDRLKSQFLANLSHELRTPLNSIIGFSEVLSDELVGKLNDEQREFIEDILSSGRHLLRLINALLDFSKIEAGHMVLEPDLLQVETLFDELRVTVTPMVDKKHQDLQFHYERSLPPLYADPMRIKQVFLNLLSNANKFTPEMGKITTVCKQIGKDQLQFTVRDTGIGIRPEDHAMIFEEFTQVDGSMTREVPGTGLGLAISKSIIEMHGGQIWVESDLGKGAAFHLTLPCKADGDYGNDLPSA